MGIDVGGETGIVSMATRSGTSTITLYYVTSIGVYTLAINDGDTTSRVLSIAWN